VISAKNCFKKHCLRKTILRILFKRRGITSKSQGK